MCFLLFITPINKGFLNFENFCLCINPNILLANEEKSGGICNLDLIKKLLVPSQYSEHPMNANEKKSGGISNLDLARFLGQGVEWVEVGRTGY